MDRTVAGARADYGASLASYLTSTGLEAARQQLPELSGDTR